MLCTDPRSIGWAAGGRERHGVDTDAPAAYNHVYEMVAGGDGGRAPGLPGRRRLPSIGLTRDLAGDIEILLVREAPGRHSEADGQKDSGN